MPSLPFTLPAFLGGFTMSSYARMMSALLPPGRLWRLFAGSLLDALLAGSADEIGRLDARVAALLFESDPRTSVELLASYESELGLPSDGTTATRQARVVARVIARQRYRPADFQTALAPILSQAIASVAIVERTPAQAATMGDAREVFRFFVYRDPTLPGSYSLADAQAIVDTIKPAHTVGTAIESLSFLCDDPHSLCDRDLLGA